MLSARSPEIGVIANETRCSVAGRMLAGSVGPLAQQRLRARLSEFEFAQTFPLCIKIAWGIAPAVASKPSRLVLHSISWFNIQLKLYLQRLS